MFDYMHYVPVLRSKAAEWTALKYLESTERHLMTPLIVVVPESLELKAQTPTYELAFQKLVKELRQSWNDNTMFIRDYQDWCTL